MICFGWRLNAGLIALHWRGFSLHLLVKPDFWVWGYREDFHDGPLPEVGAGPLVLFCWTGSLRESWAWEVA